jgi:hypothetical protein
MAKVTCGPLFQEALNTHTDMSPEQIRVFAAGFVTGQAEKIYLGACAAAMFRPSPEHMVMLREVVQETAQRYGLVAVTSHQGELWLCQPQVKGLVLCQDVRSGRDGVYHALRALLCGIPASQIDLSYHQHKHFNQPCDRPTED